MHGKTIRPGGRASAAGRVAVLAVVLAGAGFGCAGSRESPIASGPAGQLHFEVNNFNFLDVTLHAVWTGKRIRLGSISGTRSAYFTIALDGPELLQIEINQLAGLRCITPPISALPGQVIFLEIPAQLRLGRDCF